MTWLFERFSAMIKSLHRLISFLNAALELEGDKRVVNVNLANPNLFLVLQEKKLLYS